MLLYGLFCVAVIFNLIAQSAPQSVPSFHEVRYHASIQRPQMIKGLLIHNHVCSGALISAIWVLTTGTCIDNNGNFKRLRVHLASLSLKDGLRLKIDRVEHHPEYSPERLKYNFAALHLEKTMTYGPNMSIILLPSRGLLRGSDCSVTGWLINTYHTLNPELIRTNVAIVNSTELLRHCRPFYVVGQIIDFDLTHAFCAIYGDDLELPIEEGNPLVCHYFLWGLLTEGGDEHGKKYMIFSNTDFIRDWIQTLV